MYLSKLVDSTLQYMDMEKRLKRNCAQLSTMILNFKIDKTSIFIVR